MQVLGVAILGLGILFLTYYLFKEIQEVRFLKNTLTQIIGKRKIESVEDLVKIKNYLQKNISYNAKLKSTKRPLLRHTASHILTSNYGFCGENARVAIKLFMLGNIKAARIYLYGKQWGHVVIENRWNNSWFLFDGHYDEKTQLLDKQVTTIPSDKIEKYPNGYPENEYVDFCRIKLFYKIKLVASLSKIRLPSSIIYYFESPYLIFSSLGILNIFIGLLIYFYY